MLAASGSFITLKSRETVCLQSDQDEPQKLPTLWDTAVGDGGLTRRTAQDEHNGCVV